MSELSNKVAGLITAMNNLNTNAKTIDELTIKPVAIVGTDEMPIYTALSGVTEKITMSTLLTYISATIPPPITIVNTNSYSQLH